MLDIPEGDAEDMADRHQADMLAFMSNMDIRLQAVDMDEDGVLERMRMAVEEQHALNAETADNTVEAADDTEAMGYTNDSEDDNGDLQTEEHPGLLTDDEDEGQFGWMPYVQAGMAEWEQSPAVTSLIDRKLFDLPPDLDCSSMHSVQGTTNCCWPTLYERDPANYTDEDRPPDRTANTLELAEQHCDHWLQDQKKAFDQVDKETRGEADASDDSGDDWQSDYDGASDGSEWEHESVPDEAHTAPLPTVDAYVDDYRVDSDSGPRPLNDDQKRAARHALYRLRDRLRAAAIPGDEERMEALQAIDDNPLRLVIVGPAGSGKSAVIHCIRKYYALAGKLSGLVLAAPQGSCACVVGSGTCTVHSAVGFSGRRKKTRVSKRIQKRWAQAHTMLIDEFGIMDSGLCGQLSRRLSFIKARQQEYFGGIDLILVGDFNQLLPVQGGSLYDWRTQIDSVGASGDIQLGAKAYASSVDKVVFLTTVERINQGADPINARWLTVLHHIATGSCTDADVDFINSMVRQDLSAAVWREAQMIAIENKDRIEFNWHKVRDHAVRLGAFICVAPPAWETPLTVHKEKESLLGKYISKQKDIDDIIIRHISKLTERDFSNKACPGGLPLFRGMRIVVTDNNSKFGGTELGVANGITGRVWGFVPHPEDRLGLQSIPPCSRERIPDYAYYLRRPPLCVLVTIDSEYRKDKFDFTGLPAGTVPIFPFEFSGTVDIGRAWLQDRFDCPTRHGCTVPGHTNSSTHKHIHERPRPKCAGSYHLIRYGMRQFPLVPSYALTDYKSQGKTMNHIIVDLIFGSSVTKGHLAKLYVMLSRSTSAHMICLLNAIGPCPNPESTTTCFCTRCVLTGGQPPALVAHLEELMQQSLTPSSMTPA
jgi:hypothetical protein